MGLIRPQKSDRDLFDRLASEAGEALISIYLPTHMRGVEVKQDRIRLKNGISQVEERLEPAGWSPKDRAIRLESAALLLEDEEFWQHQGAGLAVLVDEQGDSTAVSLVDEVVERTTVSSVFHLRPMFSSLQALELATLVLTKGGVRLYLVSRRGVRRAAVDMPESFDDVNWFVDREKQRQRHPDGSGSGRARHGHEGGYTDEDLDRFLRAVSEALPRFESEPLVVLGDDNLVARFANHHEREVVSPANSGLAAIDDNAEIGEKARSVIESTESTLLEKHLEQVHEHLGTGDAIVSLEEGLEAAVSGRISLLALDRDAEPVWGEFDPETLQVSPHGDQRLFDVDLVDRLAVSAAGTGAEVVIHHGPVDGHPFVAVLRF